MNTPILTAAYIRLFEYSVAIAQKQGYIKTPIYLCIGQELVPAYASHYFYDYKIFGQHRCHGYYLAFGGNQKKLIDELVGRETGINGGKTGSASISSREIGMFGHSGFMGDNVPVGVGYALGSGEKVLIIAGDAAAEEDYSITSAGYAATKGINMVFICEDNDLSILTPTNVRRNWKLKNVMNAMNVKSREIDDSSSDLTECFRDFQSSHGACFANIKVQRAIWHAGSGFDGITKEDRLGSYIKEDDIIKKALREEIVPNIIRDWNDIASIDNLKEIKDTLNGIINSAEFLLK